MQPAQPPQKSGLPVVLVVDDEPAIVNLCGAVLGQAGFHVLKATGSPEALKICAQHDGSIDLLLTDLVLPPPDFQLASADNQFPHVHGHELAARAAMTRQGLRVALMSGNPDHELAAHGIQRSTLPFIKKPFANSELVAFVRSVLTKPGPVLRKSEPGNDTSEVDWFD
ncbi:response regulator [Nitrospira moscoviensis]|uniref:Putative Response Regulator n=1 Tax=Nitrospira moscoviensis TaxID=42253 RepID=A0A0K2GGH4_NITMO|nr:response regulator [Nitrospira moscoviensis]ALA60060.1 putative Response Regulator [Nitrospira moscoviensis]